jgi:hypothetical protein
MELNEFVNLILLPFGGVSVVLIGLAAFLGNVNTKRIINGDLAKHKLKFEAFQSESEIRLQSLKDQNAKDLELVKLEHAKSMDKIQNEFRTEFLKYEAYTSISKEKYQELFEKRIGVYDNFLRLKKEIDDSLIDNAEFLDIHDDDPSHFTNTVKKINEASQASPMLISNELAHLSNELFKKSSQVFSNAKVAAFYAEMSEFNDERPHHEFVMEAENDELRKMLSECSDLYEQWFKQLDDDVSKIRLILDISSEFLNKITNK